MPVILGGQEPDKVTDTPEETLPASEQQDTPEDDVIDPSFEVVEDMATESDLEPEPDEEDDEEEDEAPGIDPAADHKEEIADTEARVAEAAVYWSKIQSEAKSAKKRFDTAVADLRDLDDRGPKEMPLFEKPVTPTVEASDADYLPPLKKGQVRVRIGQLVEGTDDVDTDALNPGAVIICTVDDDADLWWQKDTGNEFMIDVGAGDTYEVLEEWPESADSPTLHQPPLQFPTPPSQVNWQDRDVHELALTKKQIETLGVDTVGELENLRKEISLGKKKWPKGIGPAAITKIEDAILDWLRDNGPKPTE